MRDKMSTQYVRAKYSEIIDLNTMPGRLSVIGVHAPIGGVPKNKLAGLYDNFRKFRYKGCSFSMAPAAQLPMDPLAISYEAGESQVDPRDLMNPILFHGTHGYTLGNAIDCAFRNNADRLSDSATRTDLRISDQIQDGSKQWLNEASYYLALSDPSWRKFSPMSPISIKGLHPLVHRVVSTMPVPPFKKGISNVNPDWSVVGTEIDGQVYARNYLQNMVGQTAQPEDLKTNQCVMQMFTSGVSRLGWLDTYSRPGVAYESGGNSIDGSGDITPDRTDLPKAFMGILVLPPAYSVKLCYRIVIHHYFEFKGFVAGQRSALDHLGGYKNELDQSVIPSTLEEGLPTSVEAPESEMSVIGTVVS